MGGSGLRELKRALDRLSTEADLGDLSPEERELAEMTLRNFRSRDAEILAEVTPFLWEHYRREADAFSAEERSSYGIPELDPSTMKLQTALRPSAVGR